MLSPDQRERQSIVEYQDFLSKTFFAGESVLLIPAHKHSDGRENDVLYLKIGDQPERPIHALGDGMQSLIISTYPIVTQTEPGCMFFLEEPDLCMHPSLQRTFLDVLRERHRRMGHQFFLTTHSNHLLDLIDDPDLFGVLSLSEVKPGGATSANADGRTASRFRIRSVKRGDREILAQLGVRPSATFLANATIWVEGVSDACYLRAYMEAFVHYLERAGGEMPAWRTTVTRLKSYTEDRYYAFVEYNGSNLTHFVFEGERSNDQTTDAKWLSAEALVIADGDIATKSTRRDDYRDQLGPRLIVLPGKEIENLIPDYLAKEMLKEDLLPGDACDGDLSKEQQATGSKINGIKYREYGRASRGKGGSAPLGLGAYLNTHMESSKYAADSGTLSRDFKRKWSNFRKGVPEQLRRAMGNKSLFEAGSIPTFLTADILCLCASIYMHIVRNNDRDDAIALRHLEGLASAYNPSNECGNRQNLASNPEGDFPWPVADPDDRRCLLKQIADQLGAASTS